MVAERGGAEPLAPPYAQALRRYRVPRHGGLELVATFAPKFSHLLPPERDGLASPRRGVQQPLLERISRDPA